MQSRPSEKTGLERRLPLLRSIQLEIDERLQRIALLEERLEGFGRTPHIHGADIRQVQAELSWQRRELRVVEKELSRLGVSFDADNPRSILTQRTASTSGPTSLGDTGFRQQVVDHRA